MYQVNYDGYTIFIGEMTGKWICFKNPLICNNSVEKITLDANCFDIYPKEVRKALSTKLCEIDIDKNNKTIPFSLLIIVTSNNCNLKCKYCYMSAGSENRAEMISSSKIIEIIDAFSNEYNRDSFEVLFQGGEPLLSFDEIKEAIKYYEQKGKKYTFCMQTNGTLLDTENIHFFKEHGVHIGISRDGFNEGSNDVRSDDSCDLNIILNEKERLLKEEYGEYGVISVVSKKNIKHIYEYALDLFARGINIFSFNPFFPIGRGSDIDDNLPEIKEYTEVMKNIFTLIYKKNMGENYLELEKYSETNIRILWEKIFKRKYEQSCCNKAPCGAAQSTFTVDWIGNIYPCTYFLPVLEVGHKLGSIENIHDAVTAGKNCIVGYRDTRKILKCSECPYAKICGGGGCFGSIYHLSGIYGESYYCEYYKEIIPFLLTNTMELLNKKILTNF